MIINLYQQVTTPTMTKHTTITDPDTPHNSTNISILWRARIDSREAVDKIEPLLMEILHGKRDTLPPEYDDIFTVEVVTRPDGSKYIDIDFS